MVGTRGGDLVDREPIRGFLGRAPARAGAERHGPGIKMKAIFVF